MPSKAQQETAIGEGLAIGCMALDVPAVKSAKMGVEFAFMRAWRSWPHAAKFPAIRADLDRNAITRILHDSQGRRNAHAAAWETAGREYVPFAKQDWSMEDLADSAGRDFSVDLEAWKELAQAFMDDLNGQH